jgi:hypothetical protein
VTAAADVDDISTHALDADLEKLSTRKLLDLLIKFTRVGTRLIWDDEARRRAGAGLAEVNGDLTMICADIEWIIAERAGSK